MRKNKKRPGPFEKAKESIMNRIIIQILIRRGRKARAELDQNSRNAVSISENLLMKLIDDNKDTEYGRKYDFAGIHSLEEYRAKVPLSTYDDYEPYIRRMKEENQQGLITVYEPKMSVS